MSLWVNSLKAHNNEYRKAIIGLEECLKAVGIALDTLQKDRNWLEVQYWKEFEKQKKLEQALDKVENNLESTKG